MARQWRIKVGVATGLALTLGLILPAALVWLGFNAEALDTTFSQPDWQPIAAYAVALAAVFATSLYASSVSQSSMKAVALTPLLLASLWTVGALTVSGVFATLDGQSVSWWVRPDLDQVSDPKVLNQMPPGWLPTLGNLQQMSLIGAMIPGAIWIGFVVQSARFNAQRLRMGWSTVSRQWGQLGGGLVAASLLGCLLFFGLSQTRAEFDYLSSFRMRREGFIQFATQAEQQGKFTSEYLSPLGITNRPSPKELVDELIRQRGFRWLSQDFVKHFQRKPVVGSNPRFLMDSGLARRYGLQTQSTSPGPTTPSTNAASSESAAQVPHLMPMSQELMKRYGLLPKGPSRSPTPTPPKTSTNQPANPASGQ
jgi:hypothetical protein